MRQYKKYLLMLGVCAATAVFATGCAGNNGTKESESAVSAAESSAAAAQDELIASIDWQQVRDDFHSVAESEFPEINSYIDFAIYEDRNTIRLIWPLKDTAGQLEALQEAPRYVRLFNDTVAVQNSSIAKSTEESYGGLFDKYILELEVFRESDLVFPELYYINQVMDPGSNDMIIPQIITEDARKNAQNSYTVTIEKEAPVNESTTAAAGSSAATDETAAEGSSGSN